MSSAFRLSLAANVVLVGIVAVMLRRGKRAASLPLDSTATPAPARSPTPEAGAVAAQAVPLNSAGSQGTRAAMAQLEQMGISRDVLVNALLGSLAAEAGWRADRALSRAESERGWLIGR